MNNSQKIVLFCTSFVLLVEILFPPFHFIVKGIERNLGYSLIWAPPEFNDYYSGTINHNTLFLEFLFISTTGILLFFAFSKIQKVTTSKLTENVQIINTNKEETTPTMWGNEQDRPPIAGPGGAVPFLEFLKTIPKGTKFKVLD